MFQGSILLTEQVLPEQLRSPTGEELKQPQLSDKQLRAWGPSNICRVSTSSLKAALLLEVLKLTWLSTNKLILTENIKKSL